jgi:DNA-binding NtrC family response regulator
VSTLVAAFQASALKLFRSTRLNLCRRAAAGEVPRALAIVAPGPARDALQAIFDDAGWVLKIADTLQSALVCQAEGPFPIVLYEREPCEHDWRAAVSLLSKLSPRPCVILLSGSCDRNLWDELGRYGGSDILRTPVDRDAVMRAVKSGWSLWRNQQKLRLGAEARS